VAVPADKSCPRLSKSIVDAVPKSSQLLGMFIADMLNTASSNKTRPWGESKKLLQKYMTIFRFHSGWRMGILGTTRMAKFAIIVFYIVYLGYHRFLTLAVTTICHPRV
jgi:hypothetical protein